MRPFAKLRWTFVAIGYRVAVLLMQAYRRPDDRHSVCSDSSSAADRQKQLLSNDQHIRCQVSQAHWIRCPKTTRNCSTVYNTSSNRVRGLNAQLSFRFSEGVTSLITFRLTHFTQSSKMGTVTKGFDAGLVNRTFLVFDFQALWPSDLKVKN